MAVRKRKPKNETEQTVVAEMQSKIERYEAFFGEIDSFIQFVQAERELLKEAISLEAELKEKYLAAKEATRTLRDSIAGSKDALFRFVEPGAMKFMPLFDRMEEADPEKHGENAEDWRKDPISALRLSPMATEKLVEADVVCVGQLQDRVLADAEGWHEEIDGITAAVAAAIMDKLNDFIMRDGDRA